MPGQAVAGINAVITLFSSDRRPGVIYVSRDGSSPRMSRLLDLARRHSVEIIQVDRAFLSRLTPLDNGGVVAIIDKFRMDRPGELMADIIRDRGLALFLDGIQDTNNLGAMIRTAVCAGVGGMFLRSHRSARIDDSVFRTSAGAAALVRASIVDDLPSAVVKFRELGGKTIGLDMAGEKTIFDTDMSGPVSLVVGSEGDGISQEALSACTSIASIPMNAPVGSLNASVSLGVATYEWVRQNPRPATSPQ